MQSSPVKDTLDPTAEIHVLTSRQDWLNMMWTLKSFYRFSSKRLTLCIHGDASLGDDEIKTLQQHFPSARIIPYAQAQQDILRWLAHFPESLALRNANPLAMKLFDFLYYLESDRLALFDSDLLFFREPGEWLGLVYDSDYRTNVFNRDIGTAYTLELAEMSEQGLDILPEVNSGFGLVHRASIKREWIEKFLSVPGLKDGYFWFVEQTLFALCSTRFGIDLLPDEYRVYTDIPLGNRPMRHYFLPVRHLMYSQGMRLLQRHLI